MDEGVWQIVRVKPQRRWFKLVISMTCKRMVREKGSGVRKFEGLVEAMRDGRWAAKVV
jgi:hypothetical protein